jgi:hypothetical protein
MAIVFGNCYVLNLKFILVAIENFHFIQFPEFSYSIRIAKPRQSHKGQQ